MQYVFFYEVSLTFLPGAPAGPAGPAGPFGPCKQMIHRSSA